MGEAWKAAPAMAVLLLLLVPLAGLPGAAADHGLEPADDLEATIILRPWCYSQGLSVLECEDPVRPQMEYTWRIRACVETLMVLQYTLVVERDVHTATKELRPRPGEARSCYVLDNAFVIRSPDCVGLEATLGGPGGVLSTALPVQHDRDWECYASVLGTYDPPYLGDG